MKFGNECYTWFMKDSGAFWDNQLAHMMEVTAKAGMTGIEPIFSWLGELADADKLEACLDKYGIELAALAFVQDWNQPQETAEEKEAADRAIKLLSRFPDAVLCTVQMPTGRHDLFQRQQNLINNINAVSCRAADADIPCSFHPNSPEGSIIRTEDDYCNIIEQLDSTVTGWTPDVGHIINGGMDPLNKMKDYQELINHVHYKDWDGNPDFALMGEGKVDLEGITKWLNSQEYDGWIICEDESPKAIDDPDGVTIHDGEWIKKSLLPLID